MATDGAKPFPKSPDDFGNDDRVSWDSVESKYVLVAGSGTEYEWNAKYGHWVEMVDEALIKAQQASYFNGQEEDASAETSAGSKKRKAETKSMQPNKAAKTERINSSIYITKIPTDATFEEIHEVFKKGGLIANNVDSERPRIKMYANDDGSFKGEALITYFRPESVQQAILLLDQTDFRDGTSGEMHVEEADLSYKKVKEHDPEAAKGKGHHTKKDREKIKRMTQNMEARLGDWSDDDPQQNIKDEKLKPAPNKFDKLVIVKHMFTLEQMEQEEDLEFELEVDIREEAKEKQWGEIAAITVFDQEPDGVVRIRFRDADSAAKAVMGMDGRFFDGRQLVAYVPEKKEVYRKSQRDEDDEERRLERFAAQLARVDEATEQQAEEQT